MSCALASKGLQTLPGFEEEIPGRNYRRLLFPVHLDAVVTAVRYEHFTLFVQADIGRIAEFSLLPAQSELATFKGAVLP
jgi:hypothetical protein